MLQGLGKKSTAAAATEAALFHREALRINLTRLFVAASIAAPVSAAHIQSEMTPFLIASLVLAIVFRSKRFSDFLISP